MMNSPAHIACPEWDNMLVEKRKLHPVSVTHSVPSGTVEAGFFAFYQHIVPDGTRVATSSERDRALPYAIDERRINMNGCGNK
jgi:hypothetical protein